MARTASITKRGELLPPLLTRPPMGGIITMAIAAPTQRLWWWLWAQKWLLLRRWWVGDEVGGSGPRQRFLWAVARVGCYGQEVRLRFDFGMIGIDVCPQGVLVAEQFVAVATFGFLLSRMSDLQMFLQVGSVADEFVADRARTSFVWVVL